MMIELPVLTRPGVAHVAVLNDPDEGYGPIPLHNEVGFEGMRRAGRLAAKLLDELATIVRPDITTESLDKFAYDFMRSHGAFPATMFYRGFWKSICTSINHVVCHGIPSPKRLHDGDIINIDVTVVLDGWYGDTSRMYYVGDVPLRARKLVDTTYEAMMRGIAAAKPGNTLGDIGYAIQSYAESLRYSVVLDFCGHGLGQQFHTAPSVVHVGRPGQGLKLVPGMFFTIEPMINIGRADTKILEDGWTAVTRDRSLSAQFEHSIGITETGCEIFTTSPKGLNQPPF
jgi:methionyl aminopeptidase